ncbi:hypothetical protein KQ874_01140 [Mycoplasma sp. ES3157-GEN-MYC]|uniref:Uncharacterized protein n=1 Tax=Mycoplasma miroungigenitalium TaxID=754515 RepID=A0A6M4JFC6_9MOLU|nr:hypothetical protein [Mycoplasma miroungigenitalium]MBU4690302.1 hypothetical protein [Mycoplasma miroungigenitalium]MBU4691569.1 hypothetical protein [Mycoplasma miroungigenitalium]QJR43401.1 hypothetical protein HLA87_01130 [Mycoplasma miroungigenitalium]
MKKMKLLLIGSGIVAISTPTLAAACSSNENKDSNFELKIANVDAKEIHSVYASSIKKEEIKVVSLDENDTKINESVKLINVMSDDSTGKLSVKFSFVDKSNKRVEKIISIEGFKILNANEINEKAKNVNFSIKNIEQENLQYEIASDFGKDNVQATNCDINEYDLHIISVIADNQEGKLLVKYLLKIKDTDIKSNVNEFAIEGFKKSNLKVVSGNENMKKLLEKLEFKHKLDNNYRSYISSKIDKNMFYELFDEKGNIDNKVEITIPFDSLIIKKSDDKLGTLTIKYDAIVKDLGNNLVERFSEVEKTFDCFNKYTSKKDMINYLTNKAKFEISKTNTEINTVYLEDIKEFNSDYIITVKNDPDSDIALPIDTLNEVFALEVTSIDGDYNGNLTFSFGITNIYDYNIDDLNIESRPFGYKPGLSIQNVVNRLTLDLKDKSTKNVFDYLNEHKDNLKDQLIIKIDDKSEEESKELLDKYGVKVNSVEVDSKNLKEGNLNLNISLAKDSSFGESTEQDYIHRVNIDGFTKIDKFNDQQLESILSGFMFSVSDKSYYSDYVNNEAKRNAVIITVDGLAGISESSLESLGIGVNKLIANEKTSIGKITNYVTYNWDNSQRKITASVKYNAADGSIKTYSWSIQLKEGDFETDAEKMIQELRIQIPTDKPAWMLTEKDIKMNEWTSEKEFSSLPGATLQENKHNFFTIGYVKTNTKNTAKKYQESLKLYKEGKMPLVFSFRLPDQTIRKYIKVYEGLKYEEIKSILDVAKEGKLFVVDKLVSDYVKEINELKEFAKDKGVNKPFGYIKFKNNNFTYGTNSKNANNKMSYLKLNGMFLDNYKNEVIPHVKADGNRKAPYLEKNSDGNIVIKFKLRSDNSNPQQVFEIVLN